VDAEPDMTEAVRAKASAVAAAHIHTITVRAEDLPAEPDSFELIVIGNAFHRLHRALIAERAYTWLKPGGCLALCWSTSPWAGPQDWQRTLDSTLRTWRNALGAAGRVPPGWDQPRQRDPDHDVLSRAGFESAGRHEFSVEHHWTIRELAGHIRSTSFLPPQVLADRAACCATSGWSPGSATAARSSTPSTTTTSPNCSTRRCTTSSTCGWVSATPPRPCPSPLPPTEIRASVTGAAS
jgi:hypothetical protein